MCRCCVCVFSAPTLPVGSWRVQVSREILGVFELSSDINGVRYIKSDMSQEALTDWHIVLMTVGGCMLLLFVLGVPSFTVMLLTVARRKVLSGSASFRRKCVLSHTLTSHSRGGVPPPRCNRSRLNPNPLSHPRRSHVAGTASCSTVTTRSEAGRGGRRW